MTINVTAPVRGGFNGQHRPALGSSPRYAMKTLRDMEAEADAQQRESARKMAEFAKLMMQRLFTDFPDLETIEIEADDGQGLSIYLDGDLTQADRDTLHAVLRSAIGKQARPKLNGTWTRERLSAPELTESARHVAPGMLFDVLG